MLGGGGVPKEANLAGPKHCRGSSYHSVVRAIQHLDNTSSFSRHEPSKLQPELSASQSRPTTTL